ncbi:MAG: peptidoglycan-binding protein, partial [Spirochaetota bacterium]
MRVGIGLALVLACGTVFGAPLAVSQTVVYIPNDGRMVPATVCLPVGTPGQTFPAVVMLHGTGSNRAEAGGGYDMLAPYLAQRGIASIRIDFAGSGDSKADYVE